MFLAVPTAMSNNACARVAKSWHNSPKFGPCYKVQGVPRRSEILIHSGNYVGDRLLNYRTNSHGCILPASKLGFLGKQKAGLLSVPAVQALNSFFVPF